MMIVLYKKFASVVAASALLINSGLPVFAQSLDITGNGAGSDNFITTEQNSTTTVYQTNSADVVNNITANADTGGNTAMFNTGGDTLLATGDARTSVLVDNTLNANVADVGCCQSQSLDVSVDGNGALSTNVVDVVKNNIQSLNQTNSAYVDNVVDANADSGNNDASLNTGGDVTIVTGNARADVGVSTMANANLATVGNNNGASGSPVSSLIINGNGAGSDNFITLERNNSLESYQTNYADILNDVDASANTGDNASTFNTGGDTYVGTGNARTLVGVDNMVNFNQLSADCGCVFGVDAKISGNGAGISAIGGMNGFVPSFLNLGGGNVINSLANTSRSSFQNSGSVLDNYLTYDSDTGNNDNSLNTSDPSGDPWLVTGHATNDVGVSNMGNVNVLGTDFNLAFDLNPLLGLVNMFHHVV